MRIARAMLAMAGIVTVMLAIAGSAAAQKYGGTLRVYHRDTPGHMSVHEEGTISNEMPMMGVFNNLVVYDQHVPQNTMSSIVPDLATAWSWDDTGTKLTFTLRDGVQWHDGKPFTAADVKCTWDMLAGKKEGLRLNFRAAWYWNIEEITTNGDREVTFRLKQPQPALLALLASGFSPVYPCHIPPAQMRTKPIGTGPFMFSDFKANQYIKVVRNPNYWKKGLPYLDGVEYTIITNRSTAILAFISGNFDLTFPFEVTIPLVRDVKSQYPEAVCQIGATNVAPNLLMNMIPPYDNRDFRRAVAMAIDHKAFVDILSEGQAAVGGAMLPPPDGIWGLPPDMLKTLPGFDPDVAKSRETAREMMRKLGYGPENRLKVKISTRNLAVYRDPAAILVDQLKEIYIDAELEMIETAQWVPKLVRQDYQFGVSLVGNGVDEPDQNFYESYVCGGRSYMGYCNKKVDELVSQQSQERDQEKRKKLVWEIDRILQEDVVRPILFFKKEGTCWRPELKNITLNTNSIYNSWRMEDWWLDR